MNSKAVSLVVLMTTVASLAIAAKKPEPKKSDAKVFYVYSNKGDRQNHFAPSGWMGDYGDLKVNDAETDNPADGRTCTKWTYSGKATQGANWAGVFYQQPPNNWGDKPGGYDLKEYKRLTFWARGAKGGETFAEFKVGGITGEHGDSDAQVIGPITLTKEWKKYEIDLKDKNLANIIGGFCWSTNRDSNPGIENEPITFYLDEIRFES